MDTKGSLKKNIRRKKHPKAQTTTPSVKRWLYGSKEEGPDEYNNDWSMLMNTSAGAEGGPFLTNYEQPMEDWTEEESQDEESSQGRAIAESETEYDMVASERGSAMPEEHTGSEGEVTFNQRKYGTRHQKPAVSNEMEGEIELNLDEIDEWDDKQLKTAIKEICYIIKNMQIKMKDYETVNRSLSRKVKLVDDKINIVKKAVIKHDACIDNNTKKLNQQEVRSMKPNLVITGIKETKGEVCVNAVQTFFKEKVKISEDIKIRIAHKIGKQGSEKCPMIVALKNVRDKGTIYKSTKNLKGQKNEEGDEYFVNDQLPAQQTEEVRKLRQKVKINKNLIDAQQQTISWKKGELHIEGKPFESKVCEPSCAEILEMKLEEMRKALSYKVYEGDETSKSGSTFKGFAAKVHSIEDVADVYRQLKYRFLEATHVICAYRIMDPDVAHMVDCVDGGEWGAGRRMTQMLIDESFQNIAVYVVRYHKGPNIGPIRFSMITDCAKSAANAVPTGVNGVLGLDRNTGFSQFRNPARLPINSLTNYAPTRGRGGSFSMPWTEGK